MVSQEDRKGGSEQVPLTDRICIKLYCTVKLYLVQSVLSLGETV